MKIAVSGATGFIGRHVLAELASRSLETVALVRPSSAGSQAYPASRVVAFDLHDAPSDAFQRLGCPDALIHLAWSGLPNYRSLHHFEHELPAQYRFLRGLIDAGLQTLVVAGTCFEYGMQSGPLSEQVTPQPDNPYGYAKNALRCQLEYLQQAQPFNLAWARLFYLYGDGQAESSLLPQLRSAVERGERFFNMSGGEQLRDYLPVSTVASHLASLALLGRDLGVVNVCSGQPVSVRGLVEDWIREHDWPIEPLLSHYPYPDYEPMAFWGSRDKLDGILKQT